LLLTALGVGLAAIRLFCLLRCLCHVFNIRGSILAPLLRFLLQLAWPCQELLLLLELVFLLILWVRILPELFGLLLVVPQYHVVAHVHYYFFSVACFLAASVAVTCPVGACGTLGFCLHLVHELSWRPLVVWACWQRTQLETPRGLGLLALADQIS